MTTKAVAKPREFFPTVFNDLFKPWNEWFDNGNGDMWGNVAMVPAVNITEGKDNFKVALAAPGMKKEDFKIDVEGDMLTISAETETKKEEKEEKFTRKEYNYTSFRRTFTLPTGVKKDKIEAKYVDGILNLILPKTEEVKRTEAKHIPVK